MLFAAAAIGWLVAGAPSEGESLDRVFVERVETSTLAASFAEMLEEELPADRVAAAREGARWIVAVAGRRGEIFVVAREDTGAIAVERAIDAGRAPSEVLAALRVAVLLVREAVLDARPRSAEASSKGPTGAAAATTTETSTAASPRVAGEGAARAEGNLLATSTSTAVSDGREGEAGADPFGAREPAELPPVEEARRLPWPVELTPMIAAIGWARPLVPPQLGFGVAIHARPNVAWRAGATAFVAGYGCCTRKTDDGSAELREVLILAEAEWTPFEFDDAGAWRGGFAGGAGAVIMYGTARAEGFAGPATESAIPRATHLQLESAFAVRSALTDRVGLRLLLGGRWTAPRRTIALVGPLRGDAPIDSGFFAPFAALGVTLIF